MAGIVGLPSYETPNGSFRTFRMEEDHYSKEFDDAPMPHAIFFTKIGHAIHGTIPSTASAARLPMAACGCPARTPQDSRAGQGAGRAQSPVTLTGSSQVALARNPPPRDNTAVARRAPQPQYEQQYDLPATPS